MTLPLLNKSSIGKVLFYVPAAVLLFFYKPAYTLGLSGCLLMSGLFGIWFTQGNNQLPHSKWWLIESSVDVLLALSLLVGFTTNNLFEWVVLCFAFRSIFIGAFAFVYAFQIIMSSNHIDYSDFVQRTAVSSLWLIVGFLLMIAQLTEKLPIGLILQLLAVVMLLYVLYLFRTLATIKKTV